jgi:hypothetical protein
VKAKTIAELALRYQLAVYTQRQPRPHLSPLDRAFWIALSRLWPRWKSVLVIVRPETVVRWHRHRFSELLAVDLSSGTWTTSDLRGDEGPDPPNGHGWLSLVEQRRSVHNGII